jgi:hypothetical protein
VGDLLRRVVSRALAQTFSTHFHTACSPFQFALSTRAGTEAVVHSLSAITELHPTRTILSIDGIGAYDNISRASMLNGLAAVPEAHGCLLFAQMWYARPSEYVWHDDSGQPHVVTQAEGGEHGDPLMPALFSLGQHPALEAVAAQLQPGEALYAFLDDVYAVVEPNRVRPVYDLLAHHLHETARIRLNSGKTRIWNKAGHQPPNTEDLGALHGWATNPYRQNSKASQYWAHPSGVQSTSSPTSSKLRHNTLLSSSTSHTSMTCKPVGSYCCTQPARAATICSACSRRT